MKIALLSCFILLSANPAAFGQNNPAPSLIQLVPSSVKPGSGVFTLTVIGADFVSGSVLRWNGSPRTTQVTSPDQLIATINAEDISKATTAMVTVANPAPGGGVSSAMYFSVQLPSATIALTPDPQLREPGMIGVGDFNGDGKLDLVVGQGCATYACSATLDFYPGLGNGKFGPRVRTWIFSYSAEILVSLYVADLNGDGLPDVAFTMWDGYGDDSFGGWVLLSNGDGTFTHAGNYLDGVAAVGDLNGDGLPDIVACGPSGGGYGPETTIYLQKPDGTYAYSQYFEDLSEQNAALGDFNGDGKLDVVFPAGYQAYNYHNVWVALGNGDGAFQSPVSYDTPNPAHSAFAIDLNGDGKLDILTDGVCVLFGNGDGTFSPGPCTGLPYTRVSEEAMVVGDFNTDGKPDVAILTEDPAAIAIYFGNGDGTFGDPQVYALPTSPGYLNPGYGAVTGLASGDFLDSGRAGFAVSGSPTAMVYSQTVARVAPTSLNLGSFPLHKTSPPQVVTFQNALPSDLQITGVALEGDQASSFAQTNNCGPNLMKGGSCEIRVTFTPTTEGAVTSFLVIDYKGIGAPQSVPVNGTGIVPTPK